MLSDIEKQEMLGQLIIDNPDLNQLESTLSEFNIFEAVGIIRQEIKHSNFLSFLLNPSENHRLGDLFLKKLLICTLLNSENPTISPVEIDITDLEDVEIRREWKNIDILIYSPRNEIVCAIENKVDSSEHSNQLERYQSIVEQEFAQCQRIFIYLTKEGYSASKKEWSSLSYSQVAEVMESICHQYKSTMGDDIHTLINHYVNLIRRHIVSNSEIARLCQKIYKQHQQALDLIYEHRPDLQLEIYEFVRQMIEEKEGDNIVIDDCTKKYIRFAPKEWDRLPFQKTCQTWTKSNRILLFECVNVPQRLSLNLVIGSGKQELKEKIFQTIQKLEISGFVNVRRLNPNGWNTIVKLKVLNKLDYSDGNLEQLQEKTEDIWYKFLDHEIKQIRNAISSLE